MTCRDLHMTGTIMNRSENLRAVCACLLVCTNRVGVFVVLSGPLRSQSQHCSSLFLFFISVSFELSCSLACVSFLTFLIGVFLLYSSSL